MLLSKNTSIAQIVTTRRTQIFRFRNQLPIMTIPMHFRRFS